MTIRFAYAGKMYDAESAKHVRLPDGTVLRVVSADAAGTIVVELAKKPNSVTDYENAVEVTADAPKNQEHKVEEDNTPKVDPRAAQRANIDALKSTWEGLTKQMLDLGETRDAVEGKLAFALTEYDKGRSRGTPPTVVVLGGKKMKAQKGRNGGAVSLVSVPEVGESL